MNSAKRFLITVLAISLLVFVSSCENNTPHVHTFSEKWTSDDSFHWHASTCGHSEAEEKVKHSFDNGTVKKAATCVENGVITYTCTVCNKSVDKTEKNANNHPSECLSYRYDSYLTKKNYKKEYCSACNKFTNNKTEEAEEGVESLTGFWVSEETTISGYTAILALSFDESTNKANYEIFFKMDDKFVLRYQALNYTYKLIWDENNTKCTAIELSYKFPVVETEYGSSMLERVITLPYTEGDTYNVLISSGEDPDGKIVENKLTKFSEKAHSEHKLKTEVTKDDYYNWEDDNLCHYVPTSCDKDLHETFYMPEDHSDSYFGETSGTDYTCTACGAFRPNFIYFHAFKEGDKTKDEIDVLENYFQGINRDQKYFTETGDTFSLSVWDGALSITYTFTGITAWYVDNSSENLKGKNIELKDGMEISFIYKDFTTNLPSDFL